MESFPAFLNSEWQPGPILEDMRQTYGWFGDVSNSNKKWGKQKESRKQLEISWRWLKRLELFKTLNRKWLTSELFVEGSLNNQNVKGNIRICSLTVWHWTNKSKRARSSKHWWWTLRLIRTSLHLSFNFFLHTISQLVSIHTIQLGHTWCNSDQNYWVVLVLGNAASNSIGKTWCYKVKGEQK